MDNSTDSEEEDLGLLRKALDVELPENFDPNKTPQDGHEYLQHVMYEAKHCKKLVVANIDRGKLKEQIYRINVKEETVKAPSSMIPTLEWQEEIIKEFSKFRKFILSKQECEPMNNITNDYKQLIKSTRPKFTTITMLTIQSKIKLLEFCLEDLKMLESGKSISDELGIWTYSVLATLDIPLEPETCHCLRELARQCSIIRSKLPNDCEEFVYTPCNLFICIVARYFKQLDLADNENDM